MPPPDFDIEWNPVVDGFIDPDYLMLPVRSKEPLRVRVPADPDLFDDNRCDFDRLDRIFAVIWWAGWHTFTVETDNGYGAGGYFGVGPRSEWVGDALARNRRRLDRSFAGKGPTKMPLPNVKIVGLDGRVLGRHERHRAYRNFETWFINR